MPQNQRSQEPPDRQGSESDAAGWIMLGDLIANLDRPDVTAAVLTTLDPVVATRIEQRAAAAAMAVADFSARAVRDFVEQADDERWFQLLTIIRKAENPGVAAIQAILGWVDSRRFQAHCFEIGFLICIKFKCVVRSLRLNRRGSGPNSRSACASRCRVRHSFRCVTSGQDRDGHQSKTPGSTVLGVRILRNREF
jgi:hypothetical protein